MYIFVSWVCLCTNWSSRMTQPGRGGTELSSLKQHLILSSAFQQTHCFILGLDLKNHSKKGFTPTKDNIITKQRTWIKFITPYIYLGFYFSGLEERREKATQALFESTHNYTSLILRMSLTSLQGRLHEEGQNTTNTRAQAYCIT